MWLFSLPNFTQEMRYLQSEIYEPPYVNCDSHLADFHGTQRSLDIHLTEFSKHSTNVRADDAVPQTDRRTAGRLSPPDRGFIHTSIKSVN
jgi:hypothetical protein